MNLLHALARDSRGATAVEYGLIVGLIAASILVAMGGVNSQINTTFDKSSSGLSASNA